MRDLSPETQRSPGTLRAASIVLVVGLVAGRFSLGSAVPALGGLDIRIAFILLTVVLLLPNLTRRARSGASGRRVLITFAVWCGWMCMSLLWAPDTADIGNVREMGYLTAFATLALLIASRLTPRDVSALWTLLIGVALAYLAGALVAGPGDQGRYSAFGGGPNVFVRIMGLGAFGVVHLFLSTRRLVVLALLPLFIVGFILSGSRGGMLAGVVVVAVGVVPLARRIGARASVQVSCLLGAACASAVVAFWDVIVDLVGNRLVEQTFEDGNTAGRDDLIAGALDEFARFPVTGGGLGSFRVWVGDALNLTYPHNLVVATLAEGGVVGAILLGVPLTIAGRALARSRPLSPTTLIATGTALFIFVCSMFSGDYYDSRFLWFFTLRAVTSTTSARSDPKRETHELAARFTPPATAHSVG